MPPASTGSHLLLPEGATALEIPFNRPFSVKSYKRPRIIPAATAVRLVPLPSERRAPRPGSAVVYVNMTTPDAGMEDDMLRVAYAYITPDTSPCRAEPELFLRHVFRTLRLALDLPQTFEILNPLFGADAAMRFRTHAQREAAIRRQPFQLDGATVELVAFRTINVAHAIDSFMVHIALHKYPNEQWSLKDIVENCDRFGSVIEVGVAEHDRSTLCVVIEVDQPRQIPYELHIEYHNGFTSVVHVHILSVWKSSESFDANGKYIGLSTIRAGYVATPSVPIYSAF